MSIPLALRDKPAITQIGQWQAMIDRARIADKIERSRYLLSVYLSEVGANCAASSISGPFRKSGQALSGSALI